MDTGVPFVGGFEEDGRRSVRDLEGFGFQGGFWKCSFE